MDRRTFIDTFARLVVAAPLAARAQSTRTARRIGYLSSNQSPTADDFQTMYAPLRALGWVEGRNLLFERRYTHGRAELLQPFAEELVRLRVELIVTTGTDATLAAKNATSTIPIVIQSAGDPVRTGLVRSLARPQGNITGYSIISLELALKRLTLIRELLPAVQRVGWLENSTNPFYRATRNDIEQACRSFGIHPIFVQAASPGEFENAIAEVTRQRGQALMIQKDNLFYPNRNEIMSLALKYGLPTIAPDREWVVEAGALISYADTWAEELQRSAAFIDRILRGANPADLPIEQPTKFELIVNLKTASALRITVPQSL